MSLIAFQSSASIHPSGWDIHVTDISQTTQAKSCFAVSPRISIPLPSNVASDDGASGQDYATIFFELHVLANYGRGYLTAHAIAPAGNNADGHYANTGLLRDIKTEPNTDGPAQVFDRLIPVRIGQTIYQANISNSSPSVFRLVKDGELLSSMDTIREIIKVQKIEPQAEAYNEAPDSMNGNEMPYPASLPLEKLESAYLQVMNCIHIANKVI